MITMETKRDFSARTAWERKFARLISDFHMRELNRLMRVLPERVNFENIPAEYWQEYTRGWTAITQPTLEAIAMAAAEEAISTVSVGVDWALVNMDAASWAQGYSFSLVSGIVDKTRNALRQIISGYYDQNMTLGELRSRLTPLFGPVRSDMIATTEVTRAAVEGERIVVSRITSESGIEFVETWQTSNDEIVCPLCGPRHGKAEGTNWTRADGPPAHPRCRCWTTHTFRMVER